MEIRWTGSIEEKIRQCIEHLHLSVQYKGQRDGVVTFRKHYVAYLRGLPNVAKLRSELMQLLDLDRIIERLNQFLDANSKSLSLPAAV